MIRNMMLGMGINVRHGEILYDNSGFPTAMIIGSYASNGEKPWTIRGRRVWIAVALASKRAYNKKWCDSTMSQPNCSNAISTIENPVVTFKLATSNTGADGSGNYVSTQSTEAHMDQSFTYKEAVKNSKELTDAILAYNSGMQAAQFCRTITLAEFGKMDLPSIDVLMRIYQARTIIDALDPTASANAEMKLSNWGFKQMASNWGDNRVYSANQSSPTTAIPVYFNGKIDTGTGKWGPFGAIPVKEIEAE